MQRRTTEELSKLKHYIYYLIDPDNNIVMYVGKSYNPVERLKTHLTLKGSYTNSFVEWIKYLRARKLKPILHIAEETTFELAYKKEQDHIRFQREINKTLTNRIQEGRHTIDSLLTYKLKHTLRNTNFSSIDEMIEICIDSYFANKTNNE